MTQAFDPTDLIFTLITTGLILLLSIDNTVAVTLIASKVGKQERKKVLWFGVPLGTAIRMTLALVAAIVIKYIWVQAIAGIYLIYLGAKSVIAAHKNSSSPTTVSRPFWKTVLTIESTDGLLTIDSVLAAFAMLTIHFGHSGVRQKIWIVAVALFLALLVERFLATHALKLLERFSFIQLVGDLLIAWIGINMIFGTAAMLWPSKIFGDFLEWGFWIGMVVIFVFGYFFARYKPEAEGK